MKPTQIVVCWDGRGGSRKRKQQNKNYKEGRAPIRLNRILKVLTEDQEKEIKSGKEAFKYLKLSSYAV